MGGKCVDEDDTTEEGEYEEGKGEGEDEDGFLPGGEGVRRVFVGWRWVSREEDEEEEHARGRVSRWVVQCREWTSR